MQAEKTNETGHLRIAGLTAGYGSVTILRDVTVNVPRGQIVAIIGPNGAGKSTLLKAITGSLNVTAGTVTAGDRNITSMGTHEIARAGVGYVPQTRHIFPRLSVRENLEMGGYSLPKKEMTSRAEEVLEGFPALLALQNRSAGNLSGGEAKMLGIARALMTKPDVLLLDEPTADLAPRIAGRFLEEQVAELARRGTAALVVEQRAREILGVASWAYLLRGGRVDLSEPADEMRDRDDIAQIFLGGG